MRTVNMSDKLWEEWQAQAAVLERVRAVDRNARERGGPPLMWVLIDELHAALGPAPAQQYYVTNGDDPIGPAPAQAEPYDSVECDPVIEHLQSLLSAAEARCAELEATLERVRAARRLESSGPHAMSGAYARIDAALGPAPAQAEPPREPFEELTGDERRDLLRGVPAYDERAKALRIIDQLTAATEPALRNRVEYWRKATEAAEARCADFELAFDTCQARCAELESLNTALEQTVNEWIELAVLTPGQAAVLKAMAGIEIEVLEHIRAGHSAAPLIFHPACKAELARRETEQPAPPGGKLPP